MRPYCAISACLEEMHSSAKHAVDCARVCLYLDDDDGDDDALLRCASQS